MNIILIMVLLGIPGTIVSYCMIRHFDCFVKRLYEVDRPLWESLGKPTGWFWAPKDSAAGNWLASQRFISVISFDMPSWARSDPDLQRHWKLCHRYMYCGYALILVLIGVSAVESCGGGTR